MPYGYVDTKHGILRIKNESDVAWILDTTDGAYKWVKIDDPEEENVVVRANGPVPLPGGFGRNQ